MTPAATRPRIYLAGPDVFFPDRAQVFERLLAQCDAVGLVGVPPTDGGLSEGLRGTDDESAQRIYEGNIALIRSADGLMANLASFRGAEPDSGTVFEVGFAIALGKPVAAYGVPESSYADRVAASIACVRDAQGALREASSGVEVEGLGQRLNLMLTRSAHVASSPEDALRWLAARIASGT
jgi:nucleoside 2-deoxyribosyltransferase